MYKKEKTQKGITLIALVITIIVMLILVGVTISMSVNGGLFDYAGNATGQTKNALNAEEQLADGRIKVGNIVYDSINQYANKDKANIDDNEGKGYVGYYADVDGDGDVDGIIYADLMVGATGDGERYDIPTIETGLKDYYVSGTFNEKKVIAAKLVEDGKDKDRFYVMALSDTITSEIPWYSSKSESGIDAATTSDDFGTGRDNTKNLIELWNADKDEEKNINDLWGQDKIQTRVKEGWFVPSADEWWAFVGELKIVDNTSVEDCLSAVCHWTSSYNEAEYDEEWGWYPLGAWSISFGFLPSLWNTGLAMDGSLGAGGAAVRLSTTF